jgi:hypothetical protein
MTILLLWSYSIILLILSCDITIGYREGDAVELIFVQLGEKNYHQSTPEGQLPPGVEHAPAIEIGFSLTNYGVVSPLWSLSVTVVSRLAICQDVSSQPICKAFFRINSASDSMKSGSSLRDGGRSRRYASVTCPRI